MLSVREGVGLRVHPPPALRNRFRADNLLKHDTLTRVIQAAQHAIDVWVVDFETSSLLGASSGELLPELIQGGAAHFLKE